MDELVRMMLEGRSDQEILSRIHEIETSVKSSDASTGDSVLKNLECKDDAPAQQDQSDYVSLVRVDGRPILPPVLNQETRSLCKSWKREAMEKESLVRLKSEKSVDLDQEQDSDISESEAATFSQTSRSDSDMEPRSFSEIRKLMMSKKFSILTPRSLVSAASFTQSDTLLPRTSSSSISNENTPRRRRLRGDDQYKADIYSDGEEEIPAFRYDSTQSVNTVIERSLTPRRLQDVLPLSTADVERNKTVQEMKESEAKSSGDTEFDRKGGETSLGFSLSGSPRRATLSEPVGQPLLSESPGQLSSSESPPKPPLSETTEQNLSSETPRQPPMSESPGQASLEESPRQHPLRRHGSYTLEKPSPLLQAHLLKFGSEEDLSLHDMSLSQRDNLPSKQESATLEQQLSPSKISYQEKDSLAKGLLTEKQQMAKITLDSVLISELEQFSHDSTPRPHVETSTDLQGSPDRLNNEFLSLNSIISTTSEEDGCSNKDLTESISQSKEMNVENDTLLVQNFDNHSDDADKRRAVAECARDIQDSNKESRSSTIVLTPQDLESRVQELADKYMRDLKHLLKKQEQERINLRLEFERQQKSLVDQILGQFPNLQSLDKENVSPHESERSNEESVSLISTVQTPSLATSKPVAGSEKLSKKVTVTLPDAALLARYSPAWTKLTALARGFLVRRLVRTEKVEALKRTIKDTVSCAVKLHLDTGGGHPSPEDVELHSRLLVQLESACQSVHHIFFCLSIPQRLSIIALDREAKKRKSDKPRSQSTEKRVTTVTKNRMERQKVSAVSQGRQVLSRLQQNSPYKGDLSTSSQTKGGSRRGAVTKHVVLAIQNKADQKKNFTEAKKNVASRRSPKKPAWK